MGYYIGKVGDSSLPVTGKAKALMEKFGATEVRHPKWDPADKKNALVCVVENGPFDAAAVVFSEQEFHAFYDDDITDARPRTWLLMDKKKAFELANVPADYL